MPRIDNEGGEAVAQWYDRVGEGTSTWDVCRSCYRDLDGKPLAELRDDPLLFFDRNRRGEFEFRFEPYGPDGEPDGILGGGVEHPPYSDEDYTCRCCDKRLTDRNA